MFSKMGIEAPVDAEGEDEGEEAFSMEEAPIRGGGPHPWRRPPP